MSVTDTSPAAVTRPVIRPLPDADVLSFIYLEARLADEGRYSEWESLWADEGPVEYRVPMHPDDDPRTTLAYINDNRRRIRSRVAQLNTGNRHSQTPPSVMRRVISNSEVVDQDSGSVTVESNFALFEYRLRQRFWAGRVIHTLQRCDDGFRLVRKIVHLIDASGPLDTLAFLI
jgi:3-phenylpropionate/cinnamic acid dioxygenase small subunit